MMSYSWSGFFECSRFCDLMMFTCRRPADRVRASRPRTPKSTSSVTFLK
jgi:hypothetical protein